MIDYTGILTGLVIKHYLCDFILQTPYQYENKGKYFHPGGLLHALITITGTLIVLLIFHTNTSQTSYILASEFLIHYHVDGLKICINKHYGWGPSTHHQY